jgi:hypothetical protein
LLKLPWIIDLFEKKKIKEEIVYRNSAKVTKKETICINGKGTIPLVIYNPPQK